MSGVWGQSVLCRELAEQQEARDAALAKEAARQRKVNQRIWQQRGASVPQKVTGQSFLGTCRDARSDEWKARKLAANTTRHRIVQLLAVRPQTADDLAATIGVSRDLVAKQITHLRIATFVRNEGWSKETGSKYQIRRIYAVTERGRRELEEVAAGDRERMRKHLGARKDERGTRNAERGSGELPKAKSQKPRAGRKAA